MKRLSLQKIWIIILLFPFVAGHGQYYDEQVLDKSFEKSDFFFHPVYLNPYGIGNFGAVAPGLIDDPLLDIQINPAYLASDSLKTHSLYLDFRNAREIKQNNYSPYWGVMDAASSCRSYIPYPQYYIETRSELEPVFSGAWIGRPLGQKSSWTTGMSIQVISQDEPYYTIPQDIYTSNIGLDYNGNRSAESFSGPITDRSGGSDEMHQEGYFVSAFTSTAIGSKLDLGLRLSRAGFDREGSWGSHYYWDNSGISDYENTSDNLTNRYQSYNHWDFSGGLNVALSPQTLFGISAGYLDGAADQALDAENLSMYRWTGNPDTSNSSYYYQGGSQNQRWDHDGQSLYGGLNLRTALDKKTVLDIHYRILKEDVDIALASGIMDTSNSRSHSSGTDYHYDSNYLYALHDNRTGSGSQDALRHFITAALRMQVGPQTRVSLGLHYEAHDVKTSTTEQVLADRFSYNEWDNQYDGHQLRQEFVDEKKSLLWDLHIESSKLQIPVIINHRLSNVFELTFGLNRSMTHYRITDETLALFDYRNITVNGIPENKTNFGERYRQPVENRSNIQTSILAGFTLSPSENFDIRLLAVPQYMKTWEGTKLQNFQWWIAFNLAH